jgi:catechol 2,3-dioxygenase-like lactoylglutathione lyase family enzyme
MSKPKEQLVPVFRVKDATKAAQWYKRLGFKVDGEHRFAPGLPLYMFLSRTNEALHLSEHAGDAKAPALVYMYVHDVEAIAAEFRSKIIDQPWAREVQLTDPDGNRLRIGERHT